MQMYLIENQSNLIKNQLKMRKLYDDAKILLGKLQVQQIIVTNRGSSEEMKHKAWIKKYDLLLKRDILISKINRQHDIINRLMMEYVE